MTEKELKSKLTYDLLKGVTKQLGYPLYTRTYDLNLGFIRTLANNPGDPDHPLDSNTFNDIMYIFYKDEYGEHQVYTAWCTTDPGLISLVNYGNPKGCAIIKEGYYSKAFVSGMHKLKRAMVNRSEAGCEPITVIRDFDRDLFLDYKSGREETGFFGIDLHGARTDRVCLNVDNWSEGCLVLNDHRDMDAVLELADLQFKYGNGKFVSFALTKQAVIEKLIVNS